MVEIFKTEIKRWIPVECPCRLCKSYVQNLGFISRSPSVREVRCSTPIYVPCGTALNSFPGYWPHSEFWCGCTLLHNHVSW